MWQVQIDEFGNIILTNPEDYNSIELIKSKRFRIN